MVVTQRPHYMETGTCIFTGTPSGIGWARDPRVTLKAGDRVTIQINGIGELTNCVENAEK